MSLDVIDLRAFYSSPLGRLSRESIGRIVRARWSESAGLTVMGLGYAPPYLREFRDRAMRVMALMGAQQGVERWPHDGATATALVDPTLLPLPDSCVDRLLIVHALEMSEQPRELLSEVWRVLSPGGRMIVVAPSRGGVWARFDTTPFGHGLPYSRSQLRDLLRDTQFLPVHWAEALYAPPSQSRLALRMAPAFERIGGRLMLPGAGVHLVEATKQLFRPVTARKSMRQALPRLEPALTPGGATRGGDARG